MTRHVMTATAASARRSTAGRGGAGRVLLALMFLGLVAMLSLPQARAASATFGWMPLWLLALPLSAWLGLQAGRRAGGG